MLGPDKNCNSYPDGSSDSRVTFELGKKVSLTPKRRSHPLRYERPFSPKTSPVTEGLKFSVLVLRSSTAEALGRSVHYRLASFVISVYVICKK